MRFHGGLVRVTLGRNVGGIFQASFRQCEVFLGVEGVNVQLELFQRCWLICSFGHGQSLFRALEIEIAGFELGLADIAFAIRLLGELEMLMAGSQLSLRFCDTWYAGGSFSDRALE